MPNFAIFTGLRPVLDRDHGMMAGVAPYLLPAAQPNVGQGDIVVKVAGVNTMPIFGYKPGDLMVCNALVAAAGTNPITGVIVGIAPINPFEIVTGNHGMTGRDRVVWVQDSIETEFAVRVDTGATVVVGQNADINYYPPNMFFGMSGVALGNSAGTATLPLKVIRNLMQVDNDPMAANAEVVVRINNSTNNPASAGV